MKLIHYTSFVFILFLFPTTSNADVITWLGGTGIWNDVNNWDIGQIPDLDDGVIINSGTVFIENYAEANYIHLDGGDVEVNSSLYVVPDIGWYGSSNQVRGVAIEYGSSFTNFGKVVLEEDSGFVGSCIFIYCNGEMINQSSGLMRFNGGQSTGIHTYTLAGTVYNYGDIEMSTINSGLYLLKPFENYGDIDIVSNDIAITNSDSFLSGTSSNLDIHGRVINLAGSTWNQYGSVDVHYTSTSGASAVTMAGHFEIQNSGFLSVDGSHAPVEVLGTGVFRNRGGMEIVNDKPYGYALANRGFLVNHQKGTISTNAHYGVFNDSSAETRNFGIWNMNDPNISYYCTLWNLGVFSNRPKGKLYVEGRLKLTSSGTFNNQGHMFALDDIVHDALDGQFNNTGTLNDVYSHMSSINNNTSIRVHKLTGPFTEGEAVLDILDIGISSEATILSWYTTATGNTIAGIYNIATNSFTPNSDAVGLNSLFVRTRINTGGVTRRHELIVENGIDDPGPLYKLEQHNAISSNGHATISPNPIMNEFIVAIENNNDPILTYTIYNSMGQKETSGDFDSGSNLISLPQHLPSGVYFIGISNEKGEHLDTQQISVIR